MCEKYGFKFMVTTLLGEWYQVGSQLYYWRDGTFGGSREL